MSAVTVSGYDEMLLRSAVSAQTAAHVVADRAAGRMERLAESHPAWFVIVIPLIVLAGIAIFAYLTVQCWNRGYSGFTGRFSRTSGWTSATIRFECA